MGEPLRSAEPPVKPNRRRHRHWFANTPVVLVASFLVLDADPVGIESDAIVGATALAYGIPLVAGDNALTNAVSKLGGEVRRL